MIVLQGGAFDVDFEADTTVGVFKQQIEKIMTDLPAERQQLVHRGLVLDNDRLLAEYHEAIAIHKMNDNDQEECVAMASSTVRARERAPKVLCAVLQLFAQLDAFALGKQRLGRLGRPHEQRSMSAMPSLPSWTIG